MEVSLRQTWVVVLMGLAVCFGGLATAFVTASSAPSPGRSPSYSLSPMSPAASAPSGYTVLGSVNVGSYPSSVVFDSANGLVYVTNMNSDNISVVNAASLSLVQTIATGLEARQGALDPLNGLLFVANDFSSNVSVINTSTDSVLTTLYFSGYSYTLEAQFDASTGQVYIEANNNDDLLAVNANTFSVTRILPFDPNPGGPPFGIDTATHILYWPSRGSLAVEPIQQLTGFAYPEIPTPSGYGPLTTFFDPVNGLLYAMLGGWAVNPGDQIVILNLTSDMVIATLTVGVFPGQYAYDSARQLLYVVCEDSNDVTVINATTNQVAGTINLGPGAAPGAIAIDPSTGNLYITEMGFNQLVELAPNSSYQVTFAESGLPSGDTWYVNVTGGPSLSGTGATPTVSTDLPNGVYSFAVATNDKTYTPAYTPSLTVRGTQVSVDVTFTSKASASTFLGLTSFEVYALVGGILAVAVVVGVTIGFTRRQRRSAPVPPPASGPPRTT